LPRSPRRSTQRGSRRRQPKGIFAVTAQRNLNSRRMRSRSRKASRDPEALTSAGVVRVHALCRRPLKVDTRYRSRQGTNDIAVKTRLHPTPPPPPPHKKTPPPPPPHPPTPQPPATPPPSTPQPPPKTNPKNTPPPPPPPPTHHRLTPPPPPKTPASSPSSATTTAGSRPGQQKMKDHGRRVGRD